MAKMMYMANVISLKLDEQRCSGCGMCIEVCPHGVFALIESKARIIGKDACMECGACAMNCASDAITVNAGVGCAAAVIAGSLRGTEPVCDCCCGSAQSTNKSCNEN